MKVHQFIESKSVQLSYYLRSFWQHDIPYTELEGFIWDTLEEWTLIENQTTEAYSARERVFWHVLQQVSYWDSIELQSEEAVKPELEMCVNCLESNQLCPFAVVGMRP